ncbi:STAS domain-containing protein [soil metagenome]|nr:STAS domain-containing protein [Acidobacteriota bacterium]
MHWTYIADRLVGDVVVIDVKGHMTLAEPESLLFGHVSRLARDDGRRKFVVNLRHLAFIDSVGIGEIVRSYTHLASQGGALKLAEVAPRVREVLEVTQLNTIIRLFESENEAVRSFAA